MTSYTKVYDAFLSQINADDWTSEYVYTEGEIFADWRAIMENAIARFKFPRVSLERNEEGFINELDQEIPVIACFMKLEWLSRTILTWENVKVQYEEKDFSQANLLDKFTKLFDTTKKDVKEIEKIYYRSVKGKPFSYSKLAGGEDIG